MRNESMWPDRVSNPGPLTFESGALPTVIGINILRVKAVIGIDILVEFYEFWLRIKPS